jgi:hypothetical protein
VRYEIVAGAGQDLEGSTGRLALIDRQVRVSSSFSPAVPPTCHKQRSRAVSSGQSR